MDITLRIATPAEQLYADVQNAQIAEQCGSPGYLHGSLDKTGTTFLSSWARNVADRNTQEFKAEFNTVIDMLRFDVRYELVLKNRAMMIAYCLDHAEGQLANGLEYVFRADTQDYSYLVRCAPNGGDDHVYIYPYRRDMLDRHMKQAEKGIRFLTLDGKEKFRIPDGEIIQITTCGAGTRRNTARFVDNHHVLIVTRYGSHLYHIHEFPEWLERHDGNVIPLRSSLPEKCFSVTFAADEIVTITKGEMGHRPSGICAEGVTAREGATAANEAMGVTKAQEAAMLYGSIYGWDKPAADPDYYNEQGEPIKFKHRDRGDAR